MQRAQNVPVGLNYNTTDHPHYPCKIISKPVLINNQLITQLNKAQFCAIIFFKYALMNWLERMPCAL